MRRIPDLYRRDPADRRFVTDAVEPGSEWVLAGEGTATRQYDGYCVLFDPLLGVNGLGVPIARTPELQGWWRRVTIGRQGINRPTDLVPLQVDADRDHLIGWEPADAAPWARHLAVAVAALTDGPRVGTHELIGPAINRNPERVPRPTLIAHADADVVDAPREYEALRAWLAAQSYKGVVWHWQQPDGTVRMVKARRRDFRA